MSEDRATYRTKSPIEMVFGCSEQQLDDALRAFWGGSTAPFDRLDHAIWRVDRAFPHASWEIAKSVIRRKDQHETEYWAEIALDRERGIEFDAYGDSPASALLAALALAEKAEAE